jgi:hypothetical protein
MLLPLRVFWIKAPNDQGVRGNGFLPVLPSGKIWTGSRLVLLQAHLTPISCRSDDARRHRHSSRREGELGKLNER